MKILLLISLFISLAFASIGQVTGIKGKATLIRESKSINLVLGHKLEKKDLIKTENRSKVQIIFNDNTIVTIGRNSSLDIEEYLFDTNSLEKSEVKLKFFRGAFKSITGKIGKVAPERFKLKTKNATIGIRGTTLAGNQNRVICERGTITVSANGITQVVPAGMMSMTPPDSPPTPPVVYKASEISLDDEAEKEEEKEKSKVKKEASKENQQKVEEKSQEKEKSSSQEETKVVKEENTDQDSSEPVNEQKIEQQETVVEKEPAQVSVVQEVKSPTINNEVAVVNTTIANTSETTGTVSNTVNDTVTSEEIEQKKEEIEIIIESGIVLDNENVEVVDGQIIIDGKEVDVVDGEIVIEEPTVEEPTQEEPTVEEPTQEEPTAEEPTQEEPTAEEPTQEEPTVEEPTQEEPAVEEPTQEEPTVEEPVVVAPPPNTQPTEPTYIDEPTIQNPNFDTSNLSTTSSYSSTYLDYGVWNNSSDSTTGFYLVGDITPNEVVQEQINTLTTAQTYSGSIIANKIEGSTITQGLSGSVGITIDFAAQEITSGTIDVVTDSSINESWTTTINSGEINKYGLSSSDISGSISSDTGLISQGVTGSLSGDFYGSSAEEIGGKFNLIDSVSSSQIEGVFGGAR